MKSLILIVIFILIGVLIASAYFSAQKLAQDRIRVGDIALIQQFLKSYKQDTGVYPPSIENQPQDWQGYLQSFPQPPPPASGCSSTDNQYTYQVLNNNKTYRLSFCLGSPQGGFGAGKNILNSTD